MTGRIKPFAYDVVETTAALIFVFDHQGADGRPASKLLAAGGLQITRPDGMIIRIGNLHPRVRSIISSKPTLIIEVGDDKATPYGADGQPIEIKTIRGLFASHFYWFIGPETSTIAEVANRPLARLLAGTLCRATAVAPGEAIHGPLMGMCLSPPGILPLTRGRQWTQARPGLIVDAGLAAGTTSGYPANDDVVGCVGVAHTEGLDVPRHQPRRSWSSQIACAFPPANPQIAEAS